MNPTDCPNSSCSGCTPASCRRRCALEVIDELLSSAGAASGEEVDLLLDLRWKLGKRIDPEEALRIFCALRLRMEQRHYLAFFRMRKWLENQLQASIRVAGEAEPHRAELRLGFYCVEAIRRATLCACLGAVGNSIRSGLSFEFAPVPERLPALALAE